MLASWAVLQVVDTLGGALRLPEWIEPMALVLLIIGLPIVLATAFVQEGVSGRDPGDVEMAAPATPPSGASGLFTWRKTFAGGVLAFALLGFVGTGWVLFGGGLRTSEPPTSIGESVAVMPCTDLSPGGDQAPIAQGLAEGIINALARLPDLKVIGITSVIALLEENADIETIAETLDVATVLECGLQQAGSVIQIGTRLVEAESGAVLWSEEINGPAEDIFEIQNAVARAVTDHLQVTLAGGAETPLVAQGTTVPEAYQAYQRGRYFWNQRTPESFQTAITAFRRAVALDPNYAEAYSGLADSYLLVDFYSSTLDYRTNFEQGLNAAEKAVSLAPDLGMAHASLGWGLWHVGEWEGAEREFELAIELSPGYATAHDWYGVSLVSIGRATEGVMHAERGMELDPVSHVISRNAAFAFAAAGRWEEATEKSRETMELDPNWSPGWLQLSQNLLNVGQYEEGREAWVNAARLTDRDIDVAREVYEAVIDYRETGEPQTFPDFEGSVVMWAYRLSGQPDRAIEIFENSRIRPGAYGLAALVHALGASDLLGDDPRYQALLEEAGITW